MSLLPPSSIRRGCAERSRPGSSPAAQFLPGKASRGVRERTLPPRVLPVYLRSTGESGLIILARAVLALAGADVFLRRGGESPDLARFAGTGSQQTGVGSGLRRQSL
jgi:hypothetical protein